MAESDIIQSLEKQEWLQPVGDTLQKGVQAVFSTEGMKPVEDFLHGTWLGHPLHPVLTDVPIGAWTVVLVLDALGGDNRGVNAAADAALKLGLIGAVGAAKTGLTDWQYTTGRPFKVGVVHALFNGTATVLNGVSLVLRAKGNRRAGKVLSLLGYGLVSAGAWLGGHLVYGEHIGVDRSTDEEPPTGWTPAMDASALEEGKPVCAEAGEARVLLMKRNGRITAIGEKCAHMGGPLSEGEVKDGCVTCPWHGSTFSLEDGSLESGPSVYPQPLYETRTRDGKIEVRALNR